MRFFLKLIYSSRSSDCATFYGPGTSQFGPEIQKLQNIPKTRIYSICSSYIYHCGILGRGENPGIIQKSSTGSEWNFYHRGSVQIGEEDIPKMCFDNILALYHRATSVGAISQENTSIKRFRRAASSRSRILASVEVS